MGVMLTRELPKGAIATSVLRLLGQTVDHSLQAELRYRSGFGIGFEFRGLVPNQREELACYCATTEELRKRRER